MPAGEPDSPSYITVKLLISDLQLASPTSHATSHTEQNILDFQSYISPLHYGEHSVKFYVRLMSLPFPILCEFQDKILFLIILLSV